MACSKSTRGIGSYLISTCSFAAFEVVSVTIFLPAALLIRSTFIGSLCSCTFTCLSMLWPWPLSFLSHSLSFCVPQGRACSESWPTPQTASYKAILSLHCWQ